VGILLTGFDCSSVAVPGYGGNDMLYDEDESMTGGARGGSRQPVDITTDPMYDTPSDTARHDDCTGPSDLIGSSG